MGDKMKSCFHDMEEQSVLGNDWNYSITVCLKKSTCSNVKLADLFLLVSGIGSPSATGWTHGDGDGEREMSSHVLFCDYIVASKVIRIIEPIFIIAACWR